MESNSYWVVLGGLAVFYAWRMFGPGRRASAGVVAGKITAGAAILDVRTPAEFRSGAYPRAKNLPLDELEGRLSSLGPPNRPIVLYCASGSRSAQAVRILRKAGFTDVSNAGSLSVMPR